VAAQKFCLNVTTCLQIDDDVLADRNTRARGQKSEGTRRHSRC
jgi:hypothetical protein